MVAGRHGTAHTYHTESWDSSELAVIKKRYADPEHMGNNTQGFIPGSDAVLLPCIYVLPLHAITDASSEFRHGESVQFPEFSDHVWVISFHGFSIYQDNPRVKEYFTYLIADSVARAQQKD